MDDMTEKYYQLDLAIEHIYDNAVPGLKIAARMAVKRLWFEIYGEKINPIW